VEIDQTIAEIDGFFKGDSNGGGQQVFRSGSQICEMFLYPNTAGMIISGLGPIPQPYYARGQSAVTQFWSNYGGLTGDNLREKPYGDLYARITAKSNTFTIYLRVQSLRKHIVTANADGSTASTSLEWDETKDQVLSEYRGYATIERYLDPLDRRFDVANSETQRLGDYINPDTENLDQAYKFRVVEKKRFTPYQ
jgi:hypothetical protein